MRTIKLIYFFFTLLVVTSCSRDDDSPSGNNAVATRTVMVYMAANNSLASDAYTNLNQMEEGFTGIDGKLIVYARIFGQEPKIYEIVHDTSPDIKSKVLKKYGDHNSSDPAVMKMIFDDMKSLAPANSYGAILWSHATNWVPANLGQLKTRSFGDDNSKSMDVQQLKSALPANLDFLIFDACSMASVEVLYELRNVAPYILASPTEVLSVGMPYHQIGRLLYTPDVKTGLTETAKAYVEYYRQKSGLEQSATFSVIDTKQLPLLAQETKKLLQNNPDVIAKISRTGVQRLDLDPNTPISAYDYTDMLDKYFPQEQLVSVKNALSKTVVYKANTSNFLGKPIAAFSGLSCYIPVEGEAYLAPFYKTLSWSQDSAYGMLLRW